MQRITVYVVLRELQIIWKQIWNFHWCEINDVFEDWDIKTCHIFINIIKFTKKKTIINIPPSP